MKKRILTLLLTQWLWQPAVLAASGTNVSQYTARVMQNAQQLADNNALADAIAKLNSAEVSRPDDVAALSKLLGIYYWQAEQFTRSIASLEKALSFELFTFEEEWVTRRMLTQLYLTQGDYKKAIPQLNKLLKQVPENESAAEIWRYLAQAQYSVENWRETIAATKGFQRVENKPDTTILSLALAAHVQLEQWKSVIPLAKQLIALEPSNKNWWLQAYNAYLNLGQEKSALDMLTLIELQGLELNEAETKSLAYLYAAQGIYQKAAQTLARIESSQQDPKLIKLQAQYWQAAKEWQQALKLWQRLAKQESQYQWEVAILENQLQRYQQVLISLAEMDNPQRQFDAQLLKINALYRLERIDQAYAQAKKADALRSTKQTQNWLKFLSHKLKSTESKLNKAKREHVSESEHLTQQTNAVADKSADSRS
ncbi:tetratricopeptide repeat protein [Vibrio vulnificus]|uniref:tetratricopeptide repeat protein n=1 Tax=Vibrio vulnificus TaxID=672 RepID=UPI000CD18CAC|nr:tetratricopeptide repeat protein [Vibrio vulnificus]EHD1698254.1 tetratricopeptide repeat protein [Vibrio vulnificus]EHU4974832.1 tetratricopeptide repeat protein [Vibrio vulnificus]MCU8446498.1 tetratricopeptide repeat protein [Vibrio vulnificus]POC06421.1 ferrichrome ABC transporter substrate-binding protein [Vibrio vulnificus]POC33841.1 ferrichrome ABC transporter substrate-binding protein [Vibrio vulnificus]